jgi:thymidylate synthase ThyX
VVIGRMVELVNDVDPLFFERVGLVTLPPEQLPEASFPHAQAGGDAFAAEFDRRLAGRVSRLCDWSPNAERIVADAVRSTFGLTERELDDDEAIDRVMNPARNPYRVDMLNVSYHSPMMRALNHASYVFEKKLSHTADSQDQRHRMVPASRPLMTFADTATPDYVTPRLIRQNAAARAVYDRAMQDAWAAKNRLLALGVPLEFALYVLPNAKALRLVESGPLIALQHKWTLRTCFNAQEEIYLASMDEVEQVRAVHPRLARHLGPPCVLRNKIVSPRCTEGSHFCGVPVWNSFPHAERRL